MKKIIINLSNRHIHLAKNDLETLFGKNYELTKAFDLKQPDQFASTEKVKIREKKGELEARVLGPVRSQTQCEVSLSDAFKLGIKNPVIRLSGDLTNSNSFEIIGPAGKIKKKEGLIVAKRHIHLDPQTAKIWQVQDGQSVKLKAGNQERKIIFEDVIVRIHENFVPECHLDFDEGNAGAIKNGDWGEVIL